MRYFCAQLAAELGAEPRVETVANMVAQMNYSNKEMLQGAMIVAGYEPGSGEGLVYGIPIGGTLVREPWAVDGSGSTYIWGFLDAEYQEGQEQGGGKKKKISREHAEAMVVEALALAMSRDASSGGVIRTVTLDARGAAARYVPGNAVPQFFEELPPPDAAPVPASSAAVVV